MILTRYIGKDILISTLAITLILLLVIVSGRFVGYMADAAAGEIPAELLQYLLIYTMPSLFQLVLPLGFFIAVMLVYGQLYVDSEMIVMQACGLSQASLLKTAMLPALIVAAVVAYCSLIVAPTGESLLRKEMEKPASTAGFSTLVAGKFQYLGNGVTVYVQSLNEDKTEMYDVFLVQEQSQDDTYRQLIVRAKRGYIDYRFDRVRYLVLAEGQQFQLEEGSLARSQIGFETFALRLPDVTSRDLKPASVDVLPTNELLFSENAEKVAALQWRLSMPLMVIIMAVVGFSLSRTTHRKGRYGKLLPGVILFFIYFTALSLMRDALEDGKVSATIGMWGIHAVMAVIAFFTFSGDRSKELLMSVVRR